MVMSAFVKIGTPVLSQWNCWHPFALKIITNRIALASHDEDSRVERYGKSWMASRNTSRGGRTVPNQSTGILYHRAESASSAPVRQITCPFASSTGRLRSLASLGRGMISSSSLTLRLVPAVSFDASMLMRVMKTCGFSGCGCPKHNLKLDHLYMEFIVFNRIITDMNSSNQQWRTRRHIPSPGVCGCTTPN